MGFTDFLNPNIELGTTKKTSSYQSTYNPVNFDLNTTSNTNTTSYSPVYSYAPQYALNSPYATQSTKKSLRASGSSVIPTTTPQVTSTSAPSQNAPLTGVSKSGSSESPFSDLISYLPFVIAGVVVYYIVKK